MVTSLDVAEYILQQKGPITAMKLQKLVYYSQAWSLALEQESLFEEPIEAWANGPVIRELFDTHRGQYHVSSIPQGDPEQLAEEQKITIDAVVIYYGQKSAQWLRDRTHAEDPWRCARGLCSDGERSRNRISFQSMEEYYAELEEDF
ncbi:MAG: DUF4065 domain-containing protein [Desulfohalobiaceae bacterium]|nr:DUF4065 domain-containing protein [Desulfohalobiaceae bacterium]MCF8086121.1 DUF4065 domain-containing protein [Desulfohalobiaceae bacterium]